MIGTGVTCVSLVTKWTAVGGLCVGALGAGAFATGSTPPSRSPSASSPSGGYAYPLKVGPTGRYLVDQAGRPFFLVGDAAWSLIAQLSDQHAEAYLANRQQLGFTAVLVNLIEHEFGTRAPADLYGLRPFTGRAFATPNEAYFAHADRVIRSAAQQGHRRAVGAGLPRLRLREPGLVRRDAGGHGRGDAGVGSLRRQSIPGRRQRHLGHRRRRRSRAGVGEDPGDGGRDPVGRHPPPLHRPQRSGADGHSSRGAAPPG